MFMAESLDAGGIMERFLIVMWSSGPRRVRVFVVESFVAGEVMARCSIIIWFSGLR